MTTLVTKSLCIFRTGTLLLIVATLIGCAGSTGSGIKQDDLYTASVNKQSVDEAKQRTRAMNIFFYQSRVGDAVMNEYPFLEAGEADPELVAAEARMMSACSYLAQAALHKVAGGEPGVRLKFMVFLTLDACENAARELDMTLRANTVLADTSL